MAEYVTKTATAEPRKLAEEDKFEISLRLLGNEVFAMQLMSRSPKANWAVFGIIMMILITILVQQILPLLQQLSGLL